MTVLIPVGVKSLTGVGSDLRRAQEIGVSLKTTLFHPTPVGEGGWAIRATFVVVRVCVCVRVGLDHFIRTTD